MNGSSASNVLVGGVWGGAFTSLAGSLTLTEWMTVGGFVLAFLSSIGNAIHKRRMLQERRREVDIQERKAGLSPFHENEDS